MKIDKASESLLLTHLKCYCEYREGDLWLKYDWGSKRKAGSLLGYSRIDGYREVMINKVRYLVHHLVWLWHNNYLPAYLDHKDGNTKNNCIENLREVTHKVNLRNTKKHKSNTSGHTGVYWNKAAGKWQAYAKINYVNYYLGLHDTIQETVTARENFIKSQEAGFTERHGK